MQISLFQRIELVFWDTFIDLYSRRPKFRKALQYLIRLWHDLRKRQAIAMVLAAAAFGYALGMALAQIFLH